MGESNSGYLRGYGHLWRLACAVVMVLLLVVVMPPAPVLAADGPLPRFNEIVTANDSFESADGSTPDWIELFNPSAAESVDLTNWALTDDPTRPQKWVFPAGTTMGPLTYLLVFASGSGVSSGGEVHTNFSLSRSDEYLALVDPAGMTVEFFNPIPTVAADDSWGIDSAGVAAYFQDPTPGATNTASSAGLLADVVAVPGRGFFSQPINVTLTSGDANATIRYTTDGSAPTESRGTVYAGPIPIAATSIIRAFSYRNDWVSSPPVTHTFIFADDVPDQSRMIESVVSGNRANIEAAIGSIPVISLVSNVSPGTPRFTFPPERSATTVEMIFPDGTEGFQVDAGTYESGGTSVAYPKDSLRLVFGDEWGESELDYPIFAGTDNAESPATDSFKRLTLRTGSHDSGVYQRVTAPHRAFVRARLHDEAMLDLGHVNTHGRFVNLFINGQYWGQYHLREHFDDHFMASYFGGDNTEYVGVNRGIVSTGEGPAWNQALAAATSWATYSQFVDPVAYVDWMLVNEYGGNTWDLRITQNWRAAGPSSDPSDTKFIFQSSDPDIALVSTTARTSFPGPGGSWQALIAEQDPDFVALVNDRINELLTGDGALTTAASRARLDKLTAQIDQSIHSESARWNWMTKAELTTALNWFSTTLFEERPANLINLLGASGLVSPLAPPTFAANGDVVAHSSIAVSNPNNSGAVVATLDGSDPRLPGGGVSATAFEIAGSLTVDHDQLVTARIRDGATWSALTVAEFTAVPAANEPLVDSIPDLTDVAGFSTGYAIDATDPGDAALSYSASGLPAGLGLDGSTGLISGTPTQVGAFDVVVTVSNGAASSSVVFKWQIAFAPVPRRTVQLVLNEYNAVQATSQLGDGGADVVFGQAEGNGGDWLELLVTEDGTDLRGWTVELSSRKNDNGLVIADEFTFSDAPVLADLRAGTLITIAEDGLEDPSYSPESGDWHIAAVARTGFDSALLTADATDFDTNRHEFRVRVFDSMGRARSPFMGETDYWDSVDGNVSGVEVMALCTLPDPHLDPIGTYSDEKAASTFGAANVCDGEPQQLIFLRGGMPGDVNCDLTVNLVDAQLILDAGVGLRAVAGRCPLDVADAVYLDGSDMNGDGQTNLLDALMITQL